MRQRNKPTPAGQPPDWLVTCRTDDDWFSEFERPQTLADAITHWSVWRFAGKQWLIDHGRDPAEWSKLVKPGPAASGGRWSRSWFGRGRRYRFEEMEEIELEYRARHAREAVAAGEREPTSPSGIDWMLR